MHGLVLGRLGARLAAVVGVVAALLRLILRSRTSLRSRLPEGWSSATVRAIDAPESEALLANDRVDGETRRGLGRAWRQKGDEAHASVASATRRAFELTRLDAPPELVAAASEVSIDEIRRTKIAFALAREIEGIAEAAVRAASGPPSIRSRWRAPGVPLGLSVPLTGGRAAELAVLAVETLLDGAVSKGVSAGTNAKLAHRATDPAIREALGEIAASAARHAAHSWAVIAWCVEEGGEPVFQALDAAGRLLDRIEWPHRTRAPVALSEEGGWERWGIAGSALTRAERMRTVENARARMASLGSSTPSALAAA